MVSDSLTRSHEACHLACWRLRRRRCLLYRVHVRLRALASVTARSYAVDGCREGKGPRRSRQGQRCPPHRLSGPSRVQRRGMTRAGRLLFSAVRCGKCKQERVTVDHVRSCYGHAPRHDQRTTVPPGPLPTSPEPDRTEAATTRPGAVTNESRGNLSGAGPRPSRGRSASRKKMAIGRSSTQKKSKGRSKAPPSLTTTGYVPPGPGTARKPPAVKQFTAQVWTCPSCAARLPTERAMHHECHV